MALVTKRIRQFKLYFKVGEIVTIDLEPGDEYKFDFVKRVLVINGVRPNAKKLKFTYTYNLDDISMRKFTVWEEEIDDGPRPAPEPETEDIPFR